MSEFKIQAECFQWHWNNFPDQRGRLFTVNNNAPSAYAGSVMKAMGVVAGVSDMIWLSSKGAVFLEFQGRAWPAIPSPKNGGRGSFKRRGTGTR